MIVELATLVDVASLERHLKAAAAHPEPHGVHVNVVGLRRTRRLAAVVAQRREILHKRVGRVLVPENYEILLVEDFYFYRINQKPSTIRLITICG